jgi:hypothetical protein
MPRKAAWFRAFLLRRLWPQMAITRARPARCSAGPSVKKSGPASTPVRRCNRILRRRTFSFRRWKPQLAEPGWYPRRVDCAYFSFTYSIANDAMGRFWLRAPKLDDVSAAVPVCVHVLPATPLRLDHELLRVAEARVEVEHDLVGANTAIRPLTGLIRGLQEDERAVAAPRSLGAHVQLSALLLDESDRLGRGLHAHMPSVPPSDRDTRRGRSESSRSRP